MAAVSLFWNTNMAAVTSSENTLSKRLLPILRTAPQILYQTLIVLNNDPTSLAGGRAIVDTSVKMTN